MDGTLSVCCCALFACLATTQSRTVPTAVDYGGGGGGSTHYGDGGGTYYGGGGGKTVGYGQRTAPAASNHRQTRDDEQHRDGQYAPYETAGTYEYMSNPSSGKNSRNRVPETERRPPGDDVELIYDRDRQNRQNGGGRGGGGGGGGGDWARDYGESRTDKRKAPAPGPSYASGGGYGGYGGGGGGGGGGGYVDSDRYGYVGGASAHAGPRYVDPDNKRRYYYYGPEARDDGSDAVRSSPSSSSSSSGTGEKKGKKKNGDGTQTKRKTTADGGGGGKGGGTASAGKTKGRQDVDVVLDEPGKRQVIKKNEYSKKREFFDEQHVKKPVGAAVAATTHDGSKTVRPSNHRHPGRRDSANKKRKRRAKKVKKGKKRDSGGGGNFGSSDSRAGRAVADLAPPRFSYGQIMAVR